MWFLNALTLTCVHFKNSLSSIWSSKMLYIKDTKYFLSYPENMNTERSDVKQLASSGQARAMEVRWSLWRLHGSCTGSATVTCIFLLPSIFIVCSPLLLAGHTAHSFYYSTELVLLWCIGPPCCILTLLQQSNFAHLRHYCGSSFIYYGISNMDSNPLQSTLTPPKFIQLKSE